MGRGASQETDKDRGECRYGAGFERRQLVNGTGQQNLSIRVHGKRKTVQGGWVLNTLFEIHLLQGQECCRNSKNSIRQVLHLIA